MAQERTWTRLAVLAVALIHIAATPDKKSTKTSKQPLLAPEAAVFVLPRIFSDLNCGG